MRKKRMPVSYVGQMIKKAREERNLTIQELVDKISNPKITVKLWKEWEKGKEFPDLDQIYILAGELDLNPNEMLNNRITIQYESIHEVDWAKRRVSEKLFGGFHKLVRWAMKWLGVICLLILVFYYKEFEKLMVADPGGTQEKLVVNTIDDAASKFVPDYRYNNDNTTDNETNITNAVNINNTNKN